MALAAADLPRRRGDGRVPPHNLDAEESLLGAMLLSTEAIAAAGEVGVTAGDFYKPAHGHVYDAICALNASGEPVDAVTVAEELRRAGLLEAVGGPGVLVSLQAHTPATSNATRYARIVEEHALLRRLIATAAEIAELGYSLPDDVPAAIDMAESLVFDVAQHRVTDSLAHIHDLLDANLDRLEQLYERGDAITGIPTGYADLDDLLSGLQPSNLVVVGARPAAGKTSLALGMASHAALHAGHPVLFFSLEMSHLELTQRLLCAEARVDSARMRNGRLNDGDWSKISHAVGRLAEAPIYIDDNPHLTVMEIRAKARRLKSRLGTLGMVVVDYLQLMTGRQAAENRQVEVSEISRGLKILARELQTPVVALSQLSRALEMRSDKRPVLADLRESGCLTADTTVMRADTGAEVTLGELFVSGARNVPVWTVNRSGALVEGMMTHVFESGTKPVFELRLASGRRVRASANHPFLTVDGWRALEELAPGARLAVPGRVPAPDSDTSWTDDEVVLAAHLASGACRLSRRSVRCTSDDPAVLDAVEKAATAFGLTGLRMRAENRWHLYLRDGVDAMLDALGLADPTRGGALPEWVFSLDERQTALLLRHVWAHSGRLAVRDGTVSATWSAPNRRAADHVRSLLLRLGIPCRVHAEKRPGRQPGQRVSIVEEDAQHRFAELVGVHGRRGRAVGAVLEHLRGAGRRPAADLAWDEIVAIDPAGEEAVYDATVPGTHNFLANGIVVHNSIEQDADVVMFIYRDELYNPESTDRGTAEVIVAKHRSGPTGVMRLAFLDHYTRFANMARGV